jgi:hypothetical protein
LFVGLSVHLDKSNVGSLFGPPDEARDEVPSELDLSTIMNKMMSKKQKDKIWVASVAKEMARPRFAESARREEESIHRVTKHRSFLST